MKVCAVLFLTLLLSLGQLLVPVPSHAFYFTAVDGCTPLDFRQTVSMRARDQGSINWCYAHTAADYLQYLYRLETPISAADIAIRYNRRNWPRMLRWLSGQLVPQSGFIRTAMWDALAEGYCPESDFPSDLWKKRTLVGKDAGNVVQKPLLDSISDLFELQNLVQAGIYSTSTDLPFRYEFPQMNQEQFFQTLFESSRSELLESLRIVACEKNRKAYPFEFNFIVQKFKGANAFPKINYQLDRGVPVALDYFYGVLENNDQFSRTISELHTSLIYGRRFNSKTNECQYLVKNSYGELCTNEYDTRNECESGYLWVSEEPLYRAMVSYEFVSDTDESLRRALDSRSVRVDP